MNNNITNKDISNKSKPQSLISLLSSLIALLERENKLLDAPDIAQITTLVEEKQNLFFEYEKQVAMLGIDNRIVNNLTNEAKTELKKLSEKFDKISDENETKLRIALRASNMVVTHIAKETEKAPGGSYINSYGNDGNSHNKRKARPITVNHTL